MNPAYDILDARIPAVEDALDIFGIGYDLVAIPIARIDFDESSHNQVRLDGPAIRWEMVEDYTELFNQGVKMPAIIGVNGDPKAPIVIMDGNHRAHAARSAGLDTIYGYVTEVVTHTQELKLKGFANSYLGPEKTRTEKLAHGIDLINDGVSLEEAARIVGLGTSALGKEYRIIKATARARKLGVLPQWKSVNKSVKGRLAGMQNETVFENAVRFFAGHYINLEHADAVVAKINQQHTEADAVSFIRDETEAMTPSKKPGKDKAGPHAREAARLSTSLNVLLTLDFDLLERWATSPTPDLAAMADKIDRVQLILARASEMIDDART